jgi:RNA polymerase sigma-B factor
MPLRHLDDRRHVRLARRAQNGDLRARDTLVCELLPLAERVARRFASRHHALDDLTQVAGIGLLKAVDRFDASREAAFVTYAHALMTGELRRYLRDSRLLRIPRPIYEQIPRFQRAMERLRADLGRSPTRQELADALGVTKEELVEIADAALTSRPVSLEAALEAGASGRGVAGYDEDFDRAEAGAALAPLLRKLSPRERMILDLRFSEGLSQAEIGEGLGVSQVQVSRLLRAALSKLSAHAAPARA